MDELFTILDYGALKNEIEARAELEEINQIEQELKKEAREHRQAYYL